MKYRHHPFCVEQDLHNPGDCAELPVDEYSFVPSPGEVAPTAYDPMSRGPGVILVLAGNYREYEHFCRRIGVPVPHYGQHTQHTPVRYIDENNAHNVMRGLSGFTFVLTGMWQARRDAYDIKDYARLLGAKIVEL